MSFSLFTLDNEIVTDRLFFSRLSSCFVTFDYISFRSSSSSCSPFHSISFWQVFVTRHPTVPKKPIVVYPKTIRRPSSAKSFFISSASSTTTKQNDKVTKQPTAHDPDTPSDSSNTISYPTYNKQTVLRNKHFM